jgi:ferritin-like metal-binding protein YciE
MEEEEMEVVRLKEARVVVDKPVSKPLKKAAVGLRKEEKAIRLLKDLRLPGEEVQIQKAHLLLVTKTVHQAAGAVARVEGKLVPAVADRHIFSSINNRIMKSQSKASGNRSISQTMNKSTNGNARNEPESMLEHFFVEQLKDMYYAEQQLLKALPKMEKECTTEELEEAFNIHTRQTEKHVKRLERVFEFIGRRPEGKKCEAMDGLIKEAETIISETKKGTMTRDAAMIIAAQKIEHYEIATYGGLVQLAITMQLYRAADILEKTLFEEEDNDELLTLIAESSINMEAEDEGVYSWQKEDEEEPEEV